MSAYVKGWIVEYFFLNHLLSLLLRHLPLHEVKGWIGLLHLYWTRQLLLLVKYRTEVTILPIVLAPVHRPYITSYTTQPPIQYNQHHSSYRGMYPASSSSSLLRSISSSSSTNGVYALSSSFSSLLFYSTCSTSFSAYSAYFSSSSSSTSYSLCSSYSYSYLSSSYSYSDWCYYSCAY